MIYLTLKKNQKKEKIQNNLFDFDKPKVKTETPKPKKDDLFDIEEEPKKK